MKKYWPLIVVILVSFLGGAAITYQKKTMAMMPFMIHFMGFFFLFLSTFKFWDLPGFHEGFQMYDLLASRAKVYGYVYPFLELIIAMGFLAHFLLPAVAIFTFILMAFSALGVVKAVMAGLDIRCACMGTKLDLPLSTVSIVENLGMGIMSLFVLIWSF